MSEEKTQRPQSIGLAAGGDTKERTDAEEAKEEAAPGTDTGFMPNIEPQIGENAENAENEEES